MPDLAGQDTPDVDFGLGMFGDLNHDGLINVFDAIILLQIDVGLVQPTPTRIVLGDLDLDGSINVFDVIIELQFSVGLLPTLFECGPIGL